MIPPRYSMWTTGTSPLCLKHHYGNQSNHTHSIIFMILSLINSIIFQIFVFIKPHPLPLPLHRAHYLSLPAQGVLCRLCNIQPPGPTWSRRASQLLFEMTKDKAIAAIITNTSVSIVTCSLYRLEIIMY